MTVKELIEILEKCTDKNKPVLLDFNVGNEKEHDIKDVFIGEMNVYLQNWKLGPPHKITL